jgi:hypothetical protein
MLPVTHYRDSYPVSGQEDWVKKAIFRLTSFTPAEAARITGVSTDSQRDWRRRGFLPQVEGHARFDAFSLVELWAMKMLSDRGIGPALTAKVLRRITIGIVASALTAIDSYEGLHESALDWDINRLRESSERRDEELRTSRHANFWKEMDQVLQEMARDPQAAYDFELREKLARGIFGSSNYWGVRAEWLTYQIVQQQTKVVFWGPHQFFVWWGDDSATWHLSLSEAFEHLPVHWDADGSAKLDRVKYELVTQRRESGPAVVLDVFNLASTLRKKVGRPLVHIVGFEDID